MDQAVSIWSPVVISELNSPRHIQGQSIYELEQVFYSMEDLKIKVKDMTIKIQGQVVEAQIKMDILCLLGDLSGDRHLISREEVLRERVSLQDFNNSLKNEKRTNLFGDIMELSWDGEINGCELKVSYFIDYFIIATREQVVRLSTEEHGEVKGKALKETLRELESQVSQVENTNRELRHKVFYYEKDISSLKRGISKVEKNNASMGKEIKYYQELLEQLQLAVREKDMRIAHYENAYYKNPYNENRPTENNDIEEKDSILNMGSRIKRMFMNSF